MKKANASEDVRIREDGVELRGTLTYPSAAQGVVLFAHGSGSSRLSPRNQQVSQVLNDAGFWTLLFDLLSEEESEDRAKVFDIPLLSSRLVLATRWLQRQRQWSGLPIGYFGASTGAAAALWAASELGDEIGAVVSRGGRPDLAIPRLREVTAPTLLIVGGDDTPVIEMNEDALNYLRKGKLVIVPGATHLFEERGALEAVARHAVNWFAQHLRKKAHPEAA